VRAVPRLLQEGTRDEGNGTRVRRLDASNDGAPGADAVLTAVDRGLCLSTAEELGAARRLRDELVLAAVALEVCAAHDPDVGSCREAGCQLVAHGHSSEATGDTGAVDPLCSLAHQLAALGLDVAEPTPHGDTDVSVDEARERFRAALRGSLDAVRMCRQVVHRSNTCWFSGVPGVDGCAQVLRTAHLVG
jgi:hypothetical protein